MRINFDFSDLEAFVAVAHSGSFQRAAEQLNTSQSAVSRRIQKLEATLEVVLFNRTTRSVSLTVEAKSFLPRAQAMLDDAVESLYALRDESIRFEHQRNSVIVVAAIPTSMGNLIPNAIKTFQAQGHVARFKIMDNLAHNVADAVVQGEADLGISFIGMNEPGLDFDFLQEDRFVIAMHKDHALSAKTALQWSDLKGESIIAPWKGTGNRLMIDTQLARTHTVLDWAFQVYHSSSAIRLVEASAGIAILPLSAISDSQHSVVVARELLNPNIVRVLSLMKRSNQALSPVATHFYQILLASCRV